MPPTEVSGSTESAPKTVEWSGNAGPLSLVRRTAATLWTARQVHKNVSRLKKELRDRPSIDDEERRRLWEDLHRQNARLAYRHISKYRGFLTKIGQATSTKAGAVPKPWVEELRKLQDQLPESKPAEVRRTIQVDLGRRVEDIFRDFDDRPVASASVAQAHVAHLRSNGAKVCVKVQHRGVAKVMGVDLAAVEYIGKKAAQWYPDAPDLSDLAREWRRASREEVDFTLERENMMRACRGLERAGVDVVCPEPVEGCCSRHVLTMTFIEGWKITEVARLPRGFDRAELGRRLVDGFMALTFGEGLIHGDPHPGNVFVTRNQRGDSANGRLSFLPVLLDWGIVTRVDARERHAMARWAISTLSQDRFMYLASLKDLGFVFSDDFDENSLSDWLHMSAWSLRDSIPSNAQLQFKEQMDKFHDQAEQGEQSPEAGSNDSKGGNEDRNILRRVPGIVMFFLRALEMLQQVCGTLDAQVSFSQSIVQWALPVLQPESCGSVPSKPLPIPAMCSDVESAVRTKLSELLDAGLILGAQVAVLKDDDAQHAGEWLCSVAAGRMGVTGPSMNEDALMPLLDVGKGVLVACFIASLAETTANGKRIGLDTPVAEVWPEFARRGKAQVTIAELLGHRAGFMKPFPKGMTLKAFCNEARVEEGIAAAPRQTQCDSIKSCPVVGEVAAALLKRVEGTDNSADALAIALKSVGLHRDIVYSADKLERDKRFASLGNRLIQSLPLSFAFEWLEERERTAQSKPKTPASEAGDGYWQSRQELNERVSASCDPLLVNCEDHQLGQVCLAARGLRATARALCKLYAHVTNAAPSDVLKRSLEDIVELDVSSLTEWESLGRSVETGLGWQLFRFQQSDGSQIHGFGQADGTTGSITLRLPGMSVCVLLNSIDKGARHVSRELISIIVSHFGLVPVWHLTPPTGVTDRARAPSVPPKAAPASEPQDVVASLHAKIAELENRVAQLLEGEDCVSTPTCGISGHWRSTEIRGLDSLLDAFEVPAATRAMAARVRRTLRIEINESEVSLGTSTTIFGRTLEDTNLQFTVGKEFRGEEGLIGGSFSGMASWKSSSNENSEADSPGTAGRVLAIERRFQCKGQEVVLQEKFTEVTPGQLCLESTLPGLGEFVVQLRTEDDREKFICSLDAAGERVVRGTQVGNQRVPRGGRLEDVPEEGLGSLAIPASVVLRYEDITCKMLFELVGGTPAREVGGKHTQTTSACVRSSPTLKTSSEQSIVKSALHGVASFAVCIASESLRLTGRACASGCNAYGPSMFHSSGCGRDRLRNSQVVGGATAEPGQDTSMLSRECDESSESRHFGDMTPMKQSLRIDTGAGVSPLLDQSDISLSARSTGSSEHVDRSDTAQRSLDQLSVLSGSIKGRDSVLSNGSEQHDREMALMQLLSQQQKMQQQLMEQMMKQQALIPQQLQAQQAVVGHQLADVQKYLAEQSLAQHRLQRQQESLAGTSCASSVRSLQSSHYDALSWRRSSAASSTSASRRDRGNRQQHAELKEALLTALDRGGQSTPSASPSASESFPPSPGPRSRAARSEEGADTMSMRSVRSSIETLQRLKERLDASAPATCSPSALATPLVARSGATTPRVPRDVAGRL